MYHLFNLFYAAMLQVLGHRLSVSLFIIQFLVFVLYLHSKVQGQLLA